MTRTTEMVRHSIPKKQTGMDLPDEIVTAYRLANSAAERRCVTHAARAVGWNSMTTARGIGISYQAVQQQLWKPADEGMVRQLAEKFPGPDPIVGTVRVKNIDLVPQELIDIIVEKRVITSRVNGVTPLDSPARVEVQNLIRLIEATLDIYDVSISALSLRAGASMNTFKLLLARHGRGQNLPPSMAASAYKHVYRHDRAGSES